MDQILNDGPEWWRMAEELSEGAETIKSIDSVGPDPTTIEAENPNKVTPKLGDSNTNHDKIVISPEKLEASPDHNHMKRTKQ